MINLSEISLSETLVILRGEYGVIKGEDILIGSPNDKNGIVLILTDTKSKITAMAHLDDYENIEQNVEKILTEIVLVGAEIENIKCKIISNK
jgi:chemotaxis receptor (MCP) glutamine deamidase CheD